MAEHSTLTDPNLHEPKGAAGASANTVYVADGAGSGSWTKPSADNVSIDDTGGNFTATDVEGALGELFSGYYTSIGLFADVSTASTILIPIPFDCTVDKIVMILAGTITTADATVTVTRSDGAAMGTQTIAQSGSVEGTSFEFTPTGNNDFTFSSHKYVKLVSDGGSTGTQPLYCQIHMTRG